MYDQAGTVIVEVTSPVVLPWLVLFITPLFTNTLLALRKGKPDLQIIAFGSIGLFAFVAL